METVFHTLYVSTRSLHTKYWLTTVFSYTITVKHCLFILNIVCLLNSCLLKFNISQPLPFRTYHRSALYISKTNWLKKVSLYTELVIFLIVTNIEQAVVFIRHIGRLGLFLPDIVQEWILHQQYWPNTVFFLRKFSQLLSHNLRNWLSSAF